mgnify:CR=1 FL=1|jgi:hypothetical protein
MGIINLDPYETGYGTTIQNSYVSLARSRITIERRIDNSAEWRLSAFFMVFESKDVSIANKSGLNLIRITKNLNVDDLNKTSFKLAYDELKLKLTNTQDDL